jgi:hypothetical protein
MSRLEEIHYHVLVKLWTIAPPGGRRTDRVMRVKDVFAT